MQKDFHHTVTYVLARLAGFEHKESNTIAYAAQYVDDATNAGTLQFENGAMYSRISSAHGTYDLHHHVNQHENHLVWVPFHFLPGNNGKTSDEETTGKFINKLVCRPDSPVSREMLDMCVRDSHKNYALHRLGITMHVYADTFAHKGFAGKIHEVNKVYDLKLENENLSYLDEKKSRGLTERFPMGHGAALECPDKPYLRWAYKNGLGEVIIRDNTEDFMHAVNVLHAELCRYRYELDNSIDVPALLAKDLEQIESNFRSFTDTKGDNRHEMWIESIANGEFSFGKQTLSYIAKGEGSWKYDAIEQESFFDRLDDRFKYKENFLNSDWKLFHDALQEHRLTIIHDVLPKYGICVS
ncbi:DUF6765 family protein [Sulfurimonas sp.]|uniref:DUF6765 family protein n=1 Tax=Sulfurimonas sp. TaxID=2022749 RepID=UPI0025FD1AF4|nr:DUF6765 family protein [Sulfurimonas sp.]